MTVARGPANPEFSEYSRAMSRVAVLCSGGVDSSVALMRLAEEGAHELTAFYLKIWLEDDMAFLGQCPWEDDLRWVRHVCERADVALEVISLQREYLDTVVSYALAELEVGQTPSPDVLCNRAIKFGAFVDRVGDRFDFVASGHHAQKTLRGRMYRLLKGADRRKDQTYFLCQLQQEQLARCLFPIGDLSKTAIRAEARRFELANAAVFRSASWCRTRSTRISRSMAFTDRTRARRDNGGQRFPAPHSDCSSSRS